MCESTRRWQQDWRLAAQGSGARIQIPGKIIQKNKNVIFLNGISYEYLLFITFRVILGAKIHV